MLWELNKLKTKTFTIGKYQAVVSNREGLYYPLTCLLTHIPTDAEKYVIEHKTANGLCYQLHKYILEQYEGSIESDYHEQYSPMLIFLGVSSIQDWLDFRLANMVVSKELDDLATDDWLLK